MVLFLLHSSNITNIVINVNSNFIKLKIGAYYLEYSINFEVSLSEIHSLRKTQEKKCWIFFNPIVTYRSIFPHVNSIYYTCEILEVNMRVTVVILITFLLLFISCKESTTDISNERESTIEILDLSPEAQSIVSSQDTIKAILRYSIAPDIQSEFGFSISIKFVSTTAGRTFYIGSNAEIEITDRDGQVILKYPLDLVWNYSDLKHPISCYFYLHKETSETSSTVIAKTEEIDYME